MDPPAFHIEASTPRVEIHAVDLHAAFREVVLPTVVATHRPGEFDGFVASLWAMYSKACTADAIAALLVGIV